LSDFLDLKCRHPTITNGKAEPLFQRALPDGEYSDYYIEDKSGDDYGNYDDYENYDDAEYTLHTELKVTCQPRYAFNRTKRSSGILVCTMTVSADGTTVSGWSEDTETVCSPGS
jgi:hypothetical protein